MSGSLSSVSPGLPLSSDLRTTLKAQTTIIYALMMHDIKSRFFGSGLGYIVTMLWPTVHIVVVVGLFSLSGRIAPFGTSLALFSATGVMPFIVMTYVSRFMVMAALANKSFLQYPIVKLPDVLFSRAFLEIVSMSFVTALVYIGISLLGVDCTPIDPVQAFEAWLGAVCLGIGLGYLNAIISMRFVFWNIGYTLVVVTLYPLSGIVFLAQGLPVSVQYYLGFNPVFQLVTWMRASYFHGYDQHMLDKAYIFEWAGGSLAAGLFLEVLLRAQLTESR